MSKENIIVPSAKLILKFREGSFRFEDVHEFYRFHGGDVFYWIEKSNKSFQLCVRGYDCSNFYPNKRVLYESHVLSDLIDKFYFHVNWCLNDKMR